MKQGTVIGAGVGAGVGGLVILVVIIVVVILVIRRRPNNKVVDVDSANRKQSKKYTTVSGVEASFPHEAAKPELISLPSLKRGHLQADLKAESELESKPEPAPVSVSASASVSPSVSAPSPVSAPAVDIVSEQCIENSTLGTQVKLGDRVKVNGYQEGVVRYIGDLKDVALSGIKYVGVELSEPEGSGDGSISGHRYFTCPDFHAVFTTVQFVEPIS